MQKLQGTRLITILLLISRLRLEMDGTHETIKFALSYVFKYATFAPAGRERPIT